MAWVVVQELSRLGVKHVDLHAPQQQARVGRVRGPQRMPTSRLVPRVLDGLPNHLAYLGEKMNTMAQVTS